jgi:hypothetical protein
MKERWSARGVDALIDYGLLLPMTLASRSRLRSIRVFGLIVQLMWTLPAMILFVPPAVLLAAVDMALDFIDGDE